MARDKACIVSVPGAAGARSSGVERAPQALLAAGLAEALAERGVRSAPGSSTAVFPARDDPEHPRARNLAGVLAAQAAAADALAPALREGFALVLGGDCSLTAGVLAGARRALGESVGLVYLDANADLNSPDTSPSGRLNGMALAMAIGRGPAEVRAAFGPPPVDPEHVALVGYRELDPGERGELGRLGLALPAGAALRLGMRVTAALALDAVANGDGPLFVHLDVDVLDPAQFQAKQTETPGRGLSWDELGGLLSAILASPRAVGLGLMEFAPERDPDGSTARRLVQLLAQALPRRLRD